MFINKEYIYISYLHMFKSKVIWLIKNIILKSIFIILYSVFYI